MYSQVRSDREGPACRLPGVSHGTKIRVILDCRKLGDGRSPGRLSFQIRGTPAVAKVYGPIMKPDEAVQDDLNRELHACEVALDAATPYSEGSLDTVEEGMGCAIEGLEQMHLCPVVFMAGKGVSVTLEACSSDDPMCCAPPISGETLLNASGSEQVGEYGSLAEAIRECLRGNFKRGGITRSSGGTRYTVCTSKP